MSDKVFRPMKGDGLEDADIPKLKFPLFASPKLDGFRCLAMNGEPKTSTLKLHTNQHIREMFSKYAEDLDGLDGELVVGEPNDPNVFDNTSGPVRRETGEPDFTFWVFDVWSMPTAPYQERLRTLVERVGSPLMPSFVKPVIVVQVNNVVDLLCYEERALEAGYEGVMLRSINGPYKHGRSTVKEGHLLKLKRTVDAEAVIIGFEEMMFNGNEAQKDNFGRTKRSSHAENKTGKDTLGKFLVRGVNGPFAGVEFSCAPGKLTRDQGKVIWDQRDGPESWLGRYITYRYLPIGCKDKPRHPRFIKERPANDVEIVEAA